MIDRLFIDLRNLYSLYKMYMEVELENALNDSLRDELEPMLDDAACKSVTVHVKRDALLVSLFDMVMKINEVLKAYGIESDEIAIEIAEYWNGRPFKIPEYAKLT